MAVPTHSSDKSTSIESMGVPVLFSIKNVQPLILAAKPTAEISNPSSSTATQVPAEPSLQSTVQPIASTSIGVSDGQPKARRAGIISKAIATGFVVMLIAIVIRFSVPGPKPSTEVAELPQQNNKDASGTLAASTEAFPNGNVTNNGPRTASRTATSEINLGSVEHNTKTPDSAVSVLPPLLSVSSTKESPANNPSVPPLISLQPPVVSQGVLNNGTPSSAVDGSELQTLEIPSSVPMTDLSQHSDSNPLDGTRSAPQPAPGNESFGSSQDLHVMETLTPERSLAEFEWLFRNATKNPLVPYRPVSTGGHDSGENQQKGEASPSYTPTGIGTPPGTAPTIPNGGPTAYQPLTISSAEAVPPYEKNLSNQSVNRYQQRIKQPAKTPLSENSNATSSTAPAPYQPLVIPGAPQAGTGGTSYGYPPVQYSPTMNGSNLSSSDQYTTGKR